MVVEVGLVVQVVEISSSWWWERVVKDVWLASKVTSSWWWENRVFSFRYADISGGIGGGFVGYKTCDYRPEVLEISQTELQN